MDLEGGGDGSNCSVAGGKSFRTGFNSFRTGFDLEDIALLSLNRVTPHAAHGQRAIRSNDNAIGTQDSNNDGHSN
jgi:hypothetical protein